MTLRELRDARSYSQNEVAAATGVTAQAVSSWERGESSPRPAQVRKLAELFKLTIEQIREVIRSSGGNPN